MFDWLGLGMEEVGRIGTSVKGDGSRRVPVHGPLVPGGDVES